ncbi:MAG: hypothetical protein L6R40_004832 [Gallowayella cf. fulva]|nr:MAG: hypothetical protein L6R40_004832 [Xanthomendoza cf. fulva]
MNHSKQTPINIPSNKLTDIPDLQYLAVNNPAPPNTPVSPVMKPSKKYQTDLPYKDQVEEQVDEDFILIRSPTATPTETRHSSKDDISEEPVRLDLPAATPRMTPDSANQASKNHSSHSFAGSIRPRIYFRGLESDISEEPVRLDLPAATPRMTPDSADQASKNHSSHPFAGSSHPRMCFRGLAPETDGSVADELRKEREKHQPKSQEAPAAVRGRHSLSSLGPIAEDNPTLAQSNESLTQFFLGLMNPAKAAKQQPANTSNITTGYITTAGMKDNSSSGRSAPSSSSGGPVVGENRTLAQAKTTENNESSAQFFPKIAEIAQTVKRLPPNPSNINTGNTSAGKKDTSLNGGTASKKPDSRITCTFFPNGTITKEMPITTPGPINDDAKSFRRDAETATQAYNDYIMSRQQRPHPHPSLPHLNLPSTQQEVTYNPPFPFPFDPSQQHVGYNPQLTDPLTPLTGPTFFGNPSFKYTTTTPLSQAPKSNTSASRAPKSVTSTSTSEARRQKFVDTRRAIETAKVATKNGGNGTFQAAAEEDGLGMYGYDDCHTVSDSDEEDEDAAGKKK